MNIMHGLPKDFVERKLRIKDKDLYNGMRVKPSMDMIVNYIEKDPYKIKYPNRDATFYLNSPQFLNLLNDSGLDLDEQSKNLSKHQMAQAQAVAAGRGGAVAMAVDAGAAPDDDAVSTTGDAEYNTRVATGQERLREMMQQDRLLEQERRRQDADIWLRRQREAELQAIRDKRLVAKQLAARTAAMAPAHPVATAAASSSSSSRPAAPIVQETDYYEMEAARQLSDPSMDQDTRDGILMSLQPQQRNKVLILLGKDPGEYDKYFKAKLAAATAVSRDPQTGIPTYSLKPSLTGMRLIVKKDVGEPADAGISPGAQTKRQATEDTSPKAKAKSGSAPSSQAIPPSESSRGIHAGTGEEASPKGGAKKTISKAHQKLRDDLKAELNYLTADSIIKKLKNEYSIDKSTKEDSDKPVAINTRNFKKLELIEIYVEASSKKGNLIRDKNTLEEENQRANAESLANPTRGGSQRASARSRGVKEGSARIRSSTRAPRGRAEGGATGGSS